ncbi:DUF6452 family protein [Maribacter arcticus]|uniref:Uncharacterized protein n=1 Tax=Maribacter arcticus TaxID=561365 RepID=A0A1T5BNS6_9FLAO|nr:DUF6452 family protein [Maribacter arcticus]SKB48749.1 hypothetical protein SAMN05660866_01785 [Maribacter arcticus]|tara:strand:- start:2087 stop:2593 length:507 start_codon:yes stop_codon:yes gene_type:complete
MRSFRIGIVLFIGILAVASCEKDDICVEGDTPLLVIEFYNINDTSALKIVPTIRVVGVGQNVTVNTVADRTALNTISIPLKTDVDVTSFIIISASASAEDGSETGNIDTVNFSYKRLEDFLSRGCGFVVNYDSLQANVSSDTNNWIKDIEIIRAQVINSDSTHVKIFH